jgi:hypothetical protein
MACNISGSFVEERLRLSDLPADAAATAIPKDKTRAGRHDERALFPDKGNRNLFRMLGG